MVWAPHNLYLDTGYGPLGEPRVRLFHYVFFPELLNGSNDGGRHWLIAKSSRRGLLEDNQLLCYRVITEVEKL